MLLVTGITGHSGRYFLQELIDNKYEGSIRCIVRETSDTSMLDNSGLDVEKFIGDIEDSEFMRKTMKDVDTVLHIAGIQKTLSVMKASITSNVRRGIFVHTTGIYSKFKSASEEYLHIESEMNKINNAKEHPMLINILRPTMIYGDICDLNMSKFIKMVDYLRFFPVIDHGKGLIQPVNARDLGKIYYQVLSTSKENLKYDYIVSGNKPITLLEAFKIISESLEKKTVFLSFPLNFGVFLARLLKGVTLGKVDYIERVQRMGEDRSFSHDDALKDFDYSPMSFNEGIRIEVKQYIEKKRS